MSKLLKSPLKWYGGKTQLAKKLLPLIPDHKTYVETFAGSAALFFGKDVSDVEVINDLNSGLVNFYRVLRDPEKYSRFEYLVNLTPFSREEFLFCRDTWRSCTQDVEKAYRWFVMMRQSYGAMGHSFGHAITYGTKGRGSSTGGYLSAIDRLPEVHARLRGVQIENLDFRTLIRSYDRPTTFFYLDPPYVLSTRKGKAYAHEMTDHDHEDLVEMLLAVEGKAMLSGYANPIYEQLECAGWQRHDFETTASVINGKTSDKREAKRVESVWVKA